MKAGKGALILLFILGSLGHSSGADTVAPTKAEVEAMYGVAAQELDAGHYDETLKQLDAIEARQPDVAAVKNLRGVALMRMGAYGPAEKALQKARELKPDFWEARFNLAEIPFLRKNWAEARDRYLALGEEPNEQAQGATADLIQFKILLTYLLQGKEKETGAILDRLKDSSVSPGFYYAKAALAFRHQDETEARVNLRAAEKAFAPPLNKLFVQSFYEIGWMEKPDGARPIAIEVTSQAERSVAAQAAFGKAERAYRAGDVERALQLLDEVDAAVPNQAAAYNLRGEILLDQGKAAEAEPALRNALAADPQLVEARQNLARLSFRKGDYEAAQKQLEELLGATAGDKQPGTREQLIRYQIYLTLLREGREGAAQKALDEFKMMAQTPALYFAQAAWAFEHGNPTQAGNWVANAGNLFSPEQNRSFATSLADLGWLPNGAGASPAPSPPMIALTNVSPSPRARASAAPIVAESTPAKPVATAAPSATPVETVAETPAPVIAKEDATREAPASTPESSVASKKIAANKKKKSTGEEEESSTGAKKKKHPARAKSTKAKTAEAPRTKKGSKEVRRAIAVNPIAPAGVGQPAPEQSHEYLGDKVVHLLLYPFQRRPEESATPAPNQNTQPANPSPSPSPSPSHRRGD